MLILPNHHRRLLLRPGVAPLNATLLLLRLHGQVRHGGGPRPKAWKKARRPEKEMSPTPKPTPIPFFRRRPTVQLLNFIPFISHDPAPDQRASPSPARHVPPHPPQQSQNAAPHAAAFAKQDKPAQTAGRQFTAPHKMKLLCAASPFSRLRHHPDTILVHAFGVCKEQYKPHAGIGVWFGPESPHNVAAVLAAADRAPGLDRQQLQRCARIKAATLALQALRDAVGNDPSERSVVLAVDQFVWKCMAERAHVLRKNGWTDSGKKLQHWQLLQELDKITLAMESAGWWVRFWGVLKTKNKDAEKLARDVIVRESERTQTPADGGGQRNVASERGKDAKAAQDVKVDGAPARVKGKRSAS